MTNTNKVTPSIFPKDDGFFTNYAAELQFREQIRGGIPKNPKIIEGWIRAKAGVTMEEEVRTMLVRTLIELGADLNPTETDMDKIMKASESIAGAQHTNGFKQDDVGLYIESRQIKAGLKETANALFAVTEKWGPTKKGPESFFAEHVFIEGDRIYLGVKEPDGIDTVIGHIKGPGGVRSTLGYVEYVLQPPINFTVQCDPRAEEAITKDHWRRIWLHFQENGLGAMRSQGHGRFNVTRWECLNGKQ